MQTSSHDRRGATASLGRVTRLAMLAALVSAPAVAQRGAAYYPDRGDAWERRAARQVGMDSARVAEAVAFAVASESRAPRDLELAHYQTFGREPFGEAVGPFAERGDPTGIILRNGYIVAEWGDPHRVDMTFSVTKSFLSTTVGLAVDRGLIRSVNDPVDPYVGPVFVLPEGGARHDAGMGAGRALRLFDTERERRITWDHLLRQTSDWEGTLWRKPDWADRPAENRAEWLTRARAEPGAAYEYNDVRVNLLALAATSVWRRPLPQVLREEVMDPIGASPTWRWVGYEDAWVLVDGQAVQSVSGGGHWGGGMFISALDMARFGYLTLRRGRWRDRQVLSEAWVRMALTPTGPQPDYGFMNWFLNTDRKLLPSAPASAFVHLGNGTNAIYVDPEHDLVIVARWIERAALDGLVQRVIASIGGGR
ncbi:MAG TPA: serine hydrolase [Longimicrobium sp.]|nr:serine hydrolase [Longimicrobium sp.]